MKELFCSCDPYNQSWALPQLEKPLKEKDKDAGNPLSVHGSSGQKADQHGLHLWQAGKKVVVVEESGWAVQICFLLTHPKSTADATYITSYNGWVIPNCGI